MALLISRLSSGAARWSAERTRRRKSRVSRSAYRARKTAIPLSRMELIGLPPALSLVSLRLSPRPAAERRTTLGRAPAPAPVSRRQSPDRRCLRIHGPRRGPGHLRVRRTGVEISSVRRQLLRRNAEALREYGHGPRVRLLHFPALDTRDLLWREPAKVRSLETLLEA